jgi:predicted Rossmann fold nucleotide-binding protein DprA/Smf involved in DNA uptake
LVQDRRPADRITLKAWERVSVLGSVELLKQPALGLFCSIRCPGKVILEVYDLARALRDGGVPVVSGFHTPMEKECLDLLLRGTQPIIVCPARGIEGIRLPRAIKAGVKAGRILVLSPFDEKQRRITADLADQRNRLVATLASEVFVAYAEPGGKTEDLCREIIAMRKPLFTVGSHENSNLLSLGAKALTAEDLVQRWREKCRRTLIDDAG